ncbi:MAG: hypothetical protein JXB04_10460 [Kiritimatiellae bacterium]|nr:hypothetical protein [Kiritimatiellia bacterium]
MSALARLSSIVGVVIAVVHLPALLFPGRTRRVVQAIPRSAVAAWTLTAVDLAWVAWIVLHASLGRFTPLKPWIYVAAPVSFIALVWLLDELLAGRALGGLLLLAANPLLNAARWHASNLRFVVTVMCYVWVVIGIMLVLSPYWLRKFTAPWVSSDGRCRAAGLAGILFGGLLLLLAKTVY